MANLGLVFCQKKKHKFVKKHFFQKPPHSAVVLAHTTIRSRYNG